jgi:ABC-2 type transport system ATP-binding protein
MAAITVQDLRKSYARFEAVRGVSFEVAEGEVFCLLGPNGAGKTTTVEILEGYRNASSGVVKVLGHDPALAQPALYERVGIVLQECGVQDDLSVAELPGHGCRGLGVPDQRCARGRAGQIHTPRHGR